MINMEIERSILHSTKTSIQQYHAVLLQFDGKCYSRSSAANLMANATHAVLLQT